MHLTEQDLTFLEEGSLLKAIPITSSSANRKMTFHKWTNLNAHVLAQEMCKFFLITFTAYLTVIKLDKTLNTKKFFWM